MEKSPDEKDERAPQYRGVKCCATCMRLDVKTNVKREFMRGVHVYFKFECSVWGDVKPHHYCNDQDYAQGINAINY